MKSVKLSYETATLELINYVKDGYQLICPRCNSNLTVNFYINPETREKLPKLIECPKNNNHYQELFDYNLKNFWEELEKKWSEEKQ